jgi:radical SAM protein with 4Fe4S-binding SPASM domain
MIESVDFMLTRNCNLRCAFCYIETHTSTSEPGEVERNLETFWWIVKQYKAGLKTNGDGKGRQRKEQCLDLVLYGGEPLCAWDSVRALVKAAKHTGIKIWFCIVSNMSLLTPEKLDWCLKHGVRVHPSIDGCPETEDFFRRTPDGKSVSKAVFANARYLTKRCPTWEVRSTIAPETAQWAFESVRYLIEDIGFPSCYQIMAGGVDWTPDAMAVIREQTIKTTDWWIEWVRRGRMIGLAYMEKMLEGIWRPIRRWCGCSSGLSHVSIDTEGQIVPCHRFCNENIPPEYILGNVHTGGINNGGLRAILRNLDMANLHKERCCRCVAVNSCNRLCLYESQQAGLGLLSPLPSYCEIQPFFWSEAMRAHAVLTAERNQLYIKTWMAKR